jgi:hypothetical protein
LGLRVLIGGWAGCFVPVVDALKARVDLMKKSDLGVETEADVLLRQAEDYASASLMRVLEGLEEDPARPNELYREYSQLLHGLEVHYLFPNLKESDREVLAELLNLRARLAVSRRAGARGESVLERRMSELLQRAEQLEGLPGLTDLQRRLMSGWFKVG